MLNTRGSLIFRPEHFEKDDTIVLTAAQLLEVVKVEKMDPRLQALVQQCVKSSDNLERLDLFPQCNLKCCTLADMVLEGHDGLGVNLGCYGSKFDFRSMRGPLFVDKASLSQMPSDAMFNKLALLCNYKSAIAPNNNSGRLEKHVDQGSSWFGYQSQWGIDTKHRAACLIEQTFVMQRIINWFEVVNRRFVPKWLFPIQKYVFTKYRGVTDTEYERYLREEMGIDDKVFLRNLGNLLQQADKLRVLSIIRDDEKLRQVSVGSLFNKRNIYYYLRDVFGVCPDLTYSNNEIKQLLIGPEQNYTTVFDLACRARETFDIVDYEWDADSHMARLVVHGILSNIALRVYKGENRKKGPLNVRMICDYASFLGFDVLEQAKYSQIAESATWIIEQTLRMIEDANNGTKLDDVLRLSARVWNHSALNSNHSKYYIRDTVEIVITGNNVACVYNMSVDPIKINAEYASFLRRMYSPPLDDVLCESSTCADTMIDANFLRHHSLDPDIGLDENDMLNIRCESPSCAATTIDAYRGRPEGMRKPEMIRHTKMKYDARNHPDGWSQACRNMPSISEGGVGRGANTTDKNYIPWFDFGVQIVGPVAFAQTVAADENWQGGEPVALYDHRGVEEQDTHGAGACTSKYGGVAVPDELGTIENYKKSIFQLEQTIKNRPLQEVLIVTKNPQREGVLREYRNYANIEDEYETFHKTLFDVQNTGTVQPQTMNMYRNPQDLAWIGMIGAAHQSIDILTPNCNSVMFNIISTLKLDDTYSKYKYNPLDVSGFKYRLVCQFNGQDLTQGGVKQGYAGTNLSVFLQMYLTNKIMYKMTNEYEFVDEIARDKEAVANIQQRGHEGMISAEEAKRLKTTSAKVKTTSALHLEGDAHEMRRAFTANAIWPGDAEDEEEEEEEEDEGDFKEPLHLAGDAKEMRRTFTANAIWPEDEEDFKEPLHLAGDAKEMRRTFTANAIWPEDAEDELAVPASAEWSMNDEEHEGQRESNSGWKRRSHPTNFNAYELRWYGAWRNPHTKLPFSPPVATQNYQDPVRPITVMDGGKEWSGGHSHAKYMGIDGEFFMTGSGNQDAQSWLGSKETNILIKDKKWGTKATNEFFNPVWERSVPFDNGGCWIRCGEDNNISLVGTKKAIETEQNVFNTQGVNVDSTLFWTTDDGRHYELAATHEEPNVEWYTIDDATRKFGIINMADLFAWLLPASSKLTFNKWKEALRTTGIEDDKQRLYTVIT